MCVGGGGFWGGGRLGALHLNELTCMYICNVVLHILVYTILNW